MLALVEQLLIVAAQAGGGAGAGGAKGNPFAGGGFIIPLMLIFMLFIWLSSRSQQKKQKAQREEMIASLKPKDKIETIGGIFGTVKEIRDADVMIRIDDAKDVSLKIAKSAVRRKLNGKKTQD